MTIHTGNRFIFVNENELECVRINEPNTVEANIVQNQVAKGQNVVIANVEILFKSNNKLNWKVLASESKIFDEFKSYIINKTTKA